MGPVGPSGYQCGSQPIFFLSKIGPKAARAPCTNRQEAREYRNHHPQKFEDAHTMDHKVVSKENESRLQHRHAALVQDL